MTPASRAVTDSVADGLYVVDGEGSILYVNQSGLRMLGYEADELIGRDVDAALYHGVLDGATCPVERSPHAVVHGMGPGYETVEGCFWRKDESMLPVAYSSSPMPLANGAGSVVVFRDISAQRVEVAAQHEAELLIRRSARRGLRAGPRPLQDDQRLVRPRRRATRCRSPWCLG